jgi:hypothetical protein
MEGAPGRQREAGWSLSYNRARCSLDNSSAEGDRSQVNVTHRAEQSKKATLVSGSLPQKTPGTFYSMRASSCCFHSVI